MVESYEVAIIGGGPAGSICAAELAKAGVDVALFDHSHPREKPCGGVIPKRIFEDFKISGKIIERRIDRLILENQKGDRVEIHEKNAGIAVMREKFDHYWLQGAINSGTTFINKKADTITKKSGGWSLRAGDKNFSANTLIGADGCPSKVRESVLGPIPRHLLGHCVTYHLPHNRGHIAEHFSNTVELHFLGGSGFDENTGYVWIFPKCEHISVGLGTKMGTPHLATQLKKFLETHPASKNILFNEKESAIHSHLIPAVSDPRFFDLPTTGKNWALIGDAAGHVNPVTAAGIYYAMMDGKLTAKAYLDGNIRLFEEYWREIYGSDLYTGARLQSLFYNPRFISLAVKLASKSTKAAEIMGEILTSRKPYSEIIYKNTPLSLPAIIGEAIFSAVTPKNKKSIYYS